MSIVMNYEAMFGSPADLFTDKLIPDMLPVSIRESWIKKTCEDARKSKKWVLIFVVGTKPCFYKFLGSVTAAENNNIPFFVVNAGQHYDAHLTYGIKEFNYDKKIAVNLSIRGDLAQKAAEIILKMSWLAKYLKKNWPDVTAIPVVLGDTILTTTVPQAWMFSRNEKAIHLEAGLRSMSPVSLLKAGKISIGDFLRHQRTSLWELITNEPFPEQYDTFTASAGCEYLFPPLEMNKQHLLREGYRKDNTFVIGGLVIEALKAKMNYKPKQSIFKIYPKLSKNKWIRIDIHRKENLTKQRLINIVNAIKDLVINKEYNVNYVEMSASKIALEEYGLQKEISSLTKYNNFLLTPVWKEYSNVVEFYNSNSCLIAVTDSGGLQEELNMLKKPCATIRFNTDRPETVINGMGNFVIPPVSGNFLSNAIEYLIKNQNLYRNIKPLYGSGAGEKFIKHMIYIMNNKKPFTWAHESMGFWKE